MRIKSRGFGDPGDTYDGVGYLLLAVAIAWVITTASLGVAEWIVLPVAVVVIAVSICCISPPFTIERDK